jgi:hypothetical protein
MYKDLAKGLTESSISFVDPAGGTTTLDSNYQPVFTPATPIVINGLFLDLSPSELVKMERLGDNSKHKLVLKDTATARQITRMYTASVDSIVYPITGVRKPLIKNAVITVYLGVPSAS